MTPAEDGMIDVSGLAAEDRRLMRRVVEFILAVSFKEDATRQAGDRGHRRDLQSRTRPAHDAPRSFLVEFEPGRKAFETRGRYQDYKQDVQAPPPRPFTARLQLGGCDRCSGALAWDELEERADGGRGCYGCLQCGSRV